MIIKMSGGMGNGAGIDAGDLPVKPGDAVLLSGPGFTDEYKIASNGVARLVEPPYVTASTGRKWRFTADKVVEL